MTGNDLGAAFTGAIHGVFILAAAAVVVAACAGCGLGWLLSGMWP